jgi:methanogenic corrinoid protein MtbC1
VFTTNASAEPLELDIFEQNHCNIRRLKQSLPEDLVANLAREVIRRLSSRDTKLEKAPIEPTREELKNLCVALISDDDKAAAEMIIGVRAEGMAPEDIYLKYLAASARMLGKWWEEDRVSFVDVTVGTGRMYAIMRGMKHHFIPAFDLVEKSAVFAAVPGETHTLGVRMAADLFRKDGWDIALKIGLDHDDLVSDIEKSPSSIVGLSVSGRHSVEALSRLVVALNICCPQAPLVVCGHDIEEIRPLLSLAGLDGVAGNVEEAKEQMDALWDRKIAS